MCGGDTKTGFIKKLYTALFASKDEKLRQKDSRLMSEFKNLMLEAGQEALDGQIESYVDAPGSVDNFEDAGAALLSAYRKNDCGNFASLVDNVRFVGQGLGGSHGKR